MNRRDAVSTVLGAVVAARPSLALAEPATLRIGFDPIDSNTNLLAAQSQGLFEKNGLAVELQVTKNGAAGAAALLAGSLDLVQINVASIVAARQKGVPFTIVALAELYTTAAPTFALVVPNDSTLRAPLDLVGKTVGVVAIGGLGWIAARAFVDQHGGDSTKIKFAEIPFPLMPEALASRRVDAIFVGEPNLSIAKRSGRIFAKAYDAVSPTFLINATVATTDWISSHVDVARRYNAAMQQASIWANRNRDKTAAILAKVANTDVATISATSRATFPERQPLVPLVQPVIDAMVKYGNSNVGVAAADLFSKDVFRLS